MFCTIFILWAPNKRGPPFFFEKWSFSEVTTTRFSWNSTNLPRWGETAELPQKRSIDEVCANWCFDEASFLIYEVRVVWMSICFPHLETLHSNSYDQEGTPSRCLYPSIKDVWEPRFQFRYVSRYSLTWFLQQSAFLLPPAIWFFSRVGSCTLWEAHCKEEHELQGPGVLDNESPGLSNLRVKSTPRIGKQRWKLMLKLPRWFPEFKESGHFLGMESLEFWISIWSKRTEHLPKKSPMSRERI